MYISSSNPQARMANYHFAQTSLFFLLLTSFFACKSGSTEEVNVEDSTALPRFTLIPTDTFPFNNFVDCNMAEAWIGDTLRIFPGKYGEDPVWGYARDLKFASGPNADVVFSTPATDYIAPTLPKNAPIGQPGLHGAIWFETVYQDERDPSGKTLYAIYHNENYPETLPYDSKTGEGYLDKNWPLGLTDRITPAAVPRIGVMKSSDGGWNWDNKGLLLEDQQSRMILNPHNSSKTFAGGVGDPSAVAVGDYVYLFYGEYGYPGTYDSATYDPAVEQSGQCISVARVKISDLEQPQGKAKRWDGTGFNAPWNEFGAPISTQRKRRRTSLFRSGRLPLGSIRELEYLPGMLGHADGTCGRTALDWRQTVHLLQSTPRSGRRQQFPSLVYSPNPGSETGACALVPFFAAAQHA